MTTPDPVTEEQVPIVDPDGSVSTVPKSYVSTAVRDEGARIASPEDIDAYRASQQAAQIRTEYSNPLLAAGLGYVRSQGFGLTDPALVEGSRALGGDQTAEETRSFLANTAAANPISSKIGELAGYIGPGLIGKGAKGLLGAVRSGGVLPRAVEGLGSAVGGAVERGAIAATGDATGTLARMAQRAAGTAAHAAVENAIQEIGMQISEDTLGDHEITAENLLARGMRGLFTGAVIGAPLGAASVLVSRGIGRNLDQFIEGDTLAEKANTASAESLGGKTPDWKKLARNEAELKEMQQRMGKRALEDDVVNFNRKDQAEMAEQAGKIRAESGKILENIRKEVDATGVKFDAKPIYDEMDQMLQGMSFDRSSVRVIKGVPTPVVERVAQAGREREYREMKNFASRLKDEMGDMVEPSKLLEVRTRLDDKIKWARNEKLSEFEKNLKVLRGSIEDTYEKEAAQVMNPIDPNWLEKYKLEKDRYAMISEIDKMTTVASMRDFSNRRLSLGDKLGGGFGAMVGAKLGAMVGGLPGGAIGGLAGGAVGTQVHNFFRERGLQMLADTLNKASKLKTVQNASLGISDAIETMAKGFVDKTVHVAASMNAIREKRDNKPRDFNKVADRITAMANNPVVAADAASKLVSPNIRDVIPNTQIAMGMRTYQIASYLAAHLPVSNGGGSYFQFAMNQERRPPSAEAVASFWRRLDAIEDPFTVLKSAKAGNLSREAVDAIKFAYPNLFGKMKQGVVNAIAQSKTPLSPQQSAALSVMFGVATDATHEPSFVRELQNAYSPDYIPPEQGGAPSGGQVSGAPKREIEVAKYYETEYEGLQSHV